MRRIGRFCFLMEAILIPSGAYVKFSYEEDTLNVNTLDKLNIQ